jgi:hypothetical protein
MDWLLNHLFVLFIVAAAVANMVQKARRAGTQQQARGVPDAGAAERTRRVQEEIRRKIAARTGRAPGEAQSAAQPPAVGPSPPSRNIFQELARQMAEAKKMAEARERERAGAEVRAQQRVEDEQKSRELAEAQQLAEAQRTLQRQEQTVATAVAYNAADLKTTAVNDARTRLLADLRGPDSLRRALVLREILGPPVGLQ